jgi:negative regulator of flagellin synthesis FlgM
MKIGHPADKPLPAPAAGTPAAPAEAAAKATAGAHATGAANVDASATVALSSTASTLLSGGAASGEFDADKVARISAQLADGSFKVNPEAIADKLIANAQELLAKVQG